MAASADFLRDLLDLRTLVRFCERINIEFGVDFWIEDLSFFWPDFARGAVEDFVWLKLYWLKRECR